MENVKNDKLQIMDNKELHTERQGFERITLSPFLFLLVMSKFHENIAFVQFKLNRRRHYSYVSVTCRILKGRVCLLHHSPSLIYDRRAYQITANINAHTAAYEFY